MKDDTITMIAITIIILCIIKGYKLHWELKITWGGVYSPTYIQVVTNVPLIETLQNVKCNCRQCWEYWAARSSIGNETCPQCRSTRIDYDTC